MKDGKAESAAELRRGPYLEALLDVTEAQEPRDRDEALDTLKEKVMHLLDQLEAAETMPAKQPPTGVWQVELTNGVVHNFVADRVHDGNGIYEIFSTRSTPGMTSFVREYGLPKTAVITTTVLAVRSEKVVAYRRLGDWDGDDDLDGYSSARWATASPASERPVAPKTAPGMYGPFATS
jgi:hypothetical protein